MPDFVGGYKKNLTFAGELIHLLPRDVVLYTFSPSLFFYSNTLSTFWLAQSIMVFSNNFR